MSIATEKLYHRDPYLTSFDANVLRCTPVGDGWEVVLDRTAFYATAGGQPHDLGVLGGRRVRDVREEEDGSIIHVVDGPVEGRVEGAIEWARRLDHMEQHTGQHLLSQAFVEELGAETISFHLGEEYCSIDIAVESLTAAQAERVEMLANRLVREDRPVVTHVVEADQVGQFPLRKAPTVETNIRIVEIQGFDWSACGGTHVASTGRLGLIKIKGWEKNKKAIRVQWLAGERAALDYLRLDETIRTLCRSLSLGVADLPAYVAKLQEEGSSLRKQIKALSDKVLEAEAVQLVGQARVVRGARIVCGVVPGRTLDEVKGLAQKVAAQPHAVALFGVKGALPQLVFARSIDLRLDMGAIMKQALPLVDGRGGGSPVAAQGGGTRPEGLEQALDLAMARVTESLAGV